MRAASPGHTHAHCGPGCPVLFPSLVVTRLGGEGGLGSGQVRRGYFPGG